MIPSIRLQFRQGVCEQCPTPCGITEEQQANPVHACPIRRWFPVDAGALNALRAVAVPPSPVDQRQAAYHALWADIHRAGAGDTIDEAFLADIRYRLRLIGCSCATDLAALLVRVPFRPADQFAWTLDLHNDINTRLGRPIWTPASALQRWCRRGKT